MSKYSKFAVGLVVFLSVVSIVSAYQTDGSADAAGGVVLLVGLFAVGIFLYFLPTVIGWHKRNAGAIFVLNLLLGWTLVGWVVAMVWAVTKEAAPTQVTINQLPLPPSLCSSCGKYSPAGSKFCATCGLTLA